ncbi:hypothetical protein AAFF_G00096940 [Aldrovandia affinis]|uniref:Uncharacterized protein n=1 Tax=Aldrovandia affinis TaxID=143900 RepID=A0AAD7RVH5_9TELE|nr:hypothetical protein AAFF_G00096940 [Aldrovandia affinis]
MSEDEAVVILAAGLLPPMHCRTYKDRLALVQSSEGHGRVAVTPHPEPGLGSKVAGTPGSQTAQLSLRWTV